MRSLGSAVVVEPLSGMSAFAHFTPNTLCFLRYYDEYASPEEWTGVRILIQPTILTFVWSIILLTLENDNDQ